MSFESAVNNLGESFSEVEADLEKDVYDVLSPHIRSILDTSQELIQKAERIKNVSEFISLLLGSHEVSVSDSTLREFKELLASPRRTATDFVFSFRFEAKEGQQQDRGLVRDEAAPLATIAATPDVFNRVRNVLHRTAWEPMLDRIVVDDLATTDFPQVIDWVQRNV